MSDIVHIQATPARPELWISSEPQVVYLHVAANSAVTESPRTPLNLCLALDRSSSMRGERLFQVKEAARQVVNQLGPDDTFALVTFNDRGEVLIPAGKATDRAALHEAISTLEAGGGTEMAQGLACGLQEIERYRQPALERLILLTDGRTYGDEQTCVELARRAQRRGIGITALGVGTEWNEDLLELMTTDENSRTQYITSVGDIVPVFTTELTRMRDTFARRVELVVTARPQTELRHAHRVQPFIAALVPQAIGAGRWRVPIGEWATGAEQQWLIELLLPPCSPGQQPIAKLELRYESIGETPVQRSTTLIVTASATSAPGVDVDADVRRVLERVTAYRLQSAAWEAARAGRLAEATNRLKQAGTHLLSAGDTGLAALAQAEATGLLRSGSASADGRKRIKYGTRGLVANSAS